jgi:hypothetical protein
MPVPREARPDAPAALHQVMIRGNGQEGIPMDDTDGKRSRIEWECW